MKKLTLTALSTALCSLSFVAISIAPSFAQATKTPVAPKTTAPAPAPASTNSSSNSQAQAVEQLKLTKDQQAKLVKLQQTVMQKKIAVLNPTQKQQLQQAMKEGKNPSLTLTPDQQTQLKAIQSAAIAEQNKILTPEQQSKLQEMNKQNSVPQQR
jgi:Spy/CpxP family protein refolding chaperone